jgi:hypothetical protein
MLPSGCAPAIALTVPRLAPRNLAPPESFEEPLRLPSTIFEWTGEQIQKSLSSITGLPQWLFPVALVAAGAVAVKYALSH